MSLCLQIDSGGIFPFRGRDATCFAGFQYSIKGAELTQQLLARFQTSAVWKRALADLALIDNFGPRTPHGYLLSRCL